VSRPPLGRMAREWGDAQAQSVEESRARAARVLAYPDLVKRLAEQPAALRDPHKWNGWIPPRTVPEVECGDRCGVHQRPCTNRHFAPANDSPIRKQLVEIAAEALRREQLALDEAQ